MCGIYGNIFIREASHLWDTRQTSKRPRPNAGRRGATGQLGSGPDRHSLRRACARNHGKKLHSLLHHMSCKVYSLPKGYAAPGENAVPAMLDPNC